MKRTVIFGFLGINLDAGYGEGRWERWRPTVALFQQEDVIYDRLELFHEAGEHEELAERILADVRQISPETETRGHILGITEPWDLEDVYERMFAFLESYPFDPDEEEYFVHLTTGTHVCQICSYLLVETRHLPGKLLQTSPIRGRPGRSSRPEGRVQEIDLDLSKYDRIATRFANEQADATDFLKSGIATRNAAFNKMIDRIEQVAVRSSEPVLLSGPTGAGKSHLARKVYELRKNRTGLKGSFVEVNCATLRGDTAASALFGHVRGSFTGAQRDRTGLLREADGGLLFLDEIGELGADEQAMLLRALEDKTFLPVGSDRPVTSNFQLIAGTNRDLRADVVSGRFREDLLARIDLWSFKLPSLAERREDIAPNLDYEIRSYSAKHGRAISFNKEARAAFLTFAENPTSTWRGNFRDLNAAIIRMATLAPRGRVRAEEVEEETQRLSKSWHRPDENNIDLPELDTEIDPFDRPQLAYVIKVCQESKTLSEAGRKLYSESRKKKANPNDADRVRKYLTKFGLSFDTINQ